MFLSPSCCKSLSQSYFKSCFKGPQTLHMKRMFSVHLSHHHGSKHAEDPTNKKNDQGTEQTKHQPHEKGSSSFSTSSSNNQQDPNNSDQNVKKAESSLPFLHEVKEELISQRHQYFLSKFFSQPVGSTTVVQYVMHTQIPKYLTALAILIVLYVLFTQIKLKTQVGEFIKQIKAATFIEKHDIDESDDKERLVKIYGKVKCSADKPLNNEKPQIEAMGKAKHSQVHHTPRQVHDILMYHYVIRSVNKGSKGSASNTEFYEIVYVTNFPIYLKFNLGENISEKERTAFENKWWSNDNIDTRRKPKVIPNFSLILDVKNENQHKNLVTTFSEEGLHKLSPNDLAPFLHTERIITTTNRFHVAEFFSELEKIAQQSSMKSLARVNNLGEAIRQGHTFYITEKVLRSDDSVLVMGHLRKEQEVLHLNCNIISCHTEKELIHNLKKQNSILARKYHEF